MPRNALARAAAALLFVALSLALAHPAGAHSTSTAYLRVGANTAELAAEIAIPLRDLDEVAGLDADGDGDITWGELRARQSAITTYVTQLLSFRADNNPCPPGPSTLLAETLSDGGYAVLRFTARCPAAPRTLTIDYHLLFDIDRLHRGLLRVELGGLAHAAVLSPAAPTATIDLTPGLGATIREFFLTGIDHLLTGIDHMLFITMLLVPAMFRRGRNKELHPVQRFRAAFVETVKVLSAFTIAHATTLTLSALHIISIPERLSESGIALTILVTAADNIWHFIPGRRWKLALAFGLVHGLGFATALGPLDLPPPQLAAALLSFNLGLEAAQITLAALVLPLGFLARRSAAYPRYVMPGISAATAMVAFAWFVDRAGDFGVMPF